ncbi:MAG: hypothetical protein EXR99_10650 [Gemmataceae bacterium]|nr:hypothetical protein [Gemmataceae bacterium]
MHIQGHRGARGNRPGNSLASLEFALDCQVDSIETDLQITADGAVVLFHDVEAARVDGKAALVGEFTLDALRTWFDRPISKTSCFPEQRVEAGPFTMAFAKKKGINPWTIPTLTDLFEFVAEYSGEFGQSQGKMLPQQECARKLVLDLEIKQLPSLAMNWRGILAGIALEAKERKWAFRVVVRSFDHGILRQAKMMNLGTGLGLLTDETILHDPVATMRDLGATLFCPKFDCLNQDMSREIQAAGFRVMPWTLNLPSAWELARDWGVDGITTDYPGWLRDWLKSCTK